MQKKGHFIEMRKRQFEFDRVFNEQFTQEDLFAAFSPLIQSALDGKKVCIFAYGQTGSGKSHTIMGNPERSELRGLIPRSLEQIFQCRESSKGKCRYDLKLSMLEIYNGTIYDLLLRSPKKSPGWTHLDIKHDDQFGGSHLVGLSIVNVLSEERTMELVRQATDRRSVRGTKMNDKSSRSHSVFTLRISGINERTNEVSNGLLNIIDLAGSERLDINDSMSKEEQAESTQINSSLLQLRKVIRALVKKEERVPFRGNALPRFLQPCLEGDTKTLMIVNISADTERKTVEESLRSLKFGSEARN
ncbi:hypothetical protein MKX03_027071 [Papaver bracteatum]|nr:hypothetical protein MKX03_027071 [Papaver bracteatum]